jgi:hypothetical protein
METKPGAKITSKTELTESTKLTFHPMRYP